MGRIIGVYVDSTSAAKKESFQDISISEFAYIRIGQLVKSASICLRLPIEAIFSYLICPTVYQNATILTGLNNC